MSLTKKLNVFCKLFGNKLSPKITNNATFCNKANFPRAQRKWTETIKFVNFNSYPSIPVYRVLDKEGNIIDSNEDPKLSKETLIKIYKTMTSMNTIDKILYESQRQGRISFYLTNFGEEGIIGSGVALTKDDIIYPQYRENSVLMWRGITVSEIVDQCLGNVDDIGRGKQMPGAYGSKNLNLVTISSPIATRMPQSVGAAYAVKGQNKVVVCYFGEGATSEGDAHAAFNFAATLECPVIFFCRNNGYAISTPTEEQYRGDGIAGRGPGYGISSVRVDGNDVFAVYNATKRAKEYCFAENKPVLIEALTYRVSHHSTSDDSLTYRSLDEINEWSKNHNPITKFRTYLENIGLWNESMEQEWLNEIKQNCLTALEESEKKQKPNWSELFVDVYQDMPHHIKKQMNELNMHIENYKDKYATHKFQH